MDGKMSMLITTMPKNHAGRGECKKPSPFFKKKKKAIPRNKQLNVADRLYRPQSK